MSTGKHDAPVDELAATQTATDVSQGGPGGKPLAPMQLGRYRVHELLGAGGMGAVFRAHDPQLLRDVAIKIVHLGAGETSARERLLREAQALARVKHPNVVSIYDVGTDGNIVYLAMELLRGRTLKTWLAEAQPATEQILATFSAAG